MRHGLETNVRERTANDFKLDLPTQTIPRYIAVEGPIGVGKTTLAKRLAETFNYSTLLEEAEENPFLERFYQDRSSNALPTQLFFLFQRMRKLQEIRQGDMFQEVRVSDFLIEKDPLFAKVTLDATTRLVNRQRYPISKLLFNDFELPVPCCSTCTTADCRENSR